MARGLRQVIHAQALLAPWLLHPQPKTGIVLRVNTVLGRSPTRLKVLLTQPAGRKPATLGRLRRHRLAPAPVVLPMPQLSKKGGIPPNVQQPVLRDTRVLTRGMPNNHATRQHLTRVLPEQKHFLRQVLLTPRMLILVLLEMK